MSSNGRSRRVWSNKTGRVHHLLSDVEYNLFLALMTVIGIVLVASGHRGVGAALVFAGAGSMLAAALVLVASSRQMIRAAVTQGLFPLLAVVALAASLL